MYLSSINYQPNIKNNYVSFQSKAKVNEKLINGNRNTVRVLAATVLAALGFKTVKNAAKEAETTAPTLVETKAEELSTQKTEIQTKTIQKTSEEILNEKVETWEELFKKTEEIYKTRDIERKRTGSANEYSGVYNYDMSTVKNKKHGKIANEGITVRLGLNLITKYAEKIKNIEKMDWKDCWDIPWEDLTKAQQYNFAKYAYESKRIKTHYSQEKIGHAEWWEKDCGKQTIYHDYPFEGATHESEDYYETTYELEGYGKIINKDNGPKYYEGKDPRPECRVLWDMQQNGTDNMGFKELKELDKI